VFFDPSAGGFWRAYDPAYLRARDVAVWLTTLVAMPAVAPSWSSSSARPGPLLIPARVVLMLGDVRSRPRRCQSRVKGMGPPAPIDRDRVRRRRTFPSVVGPARAIVEELFFVAGSPRARSGRCRRRGGSAAMARARYGSAALPSAPPWGAAHAAARISSATWCSPGCSVFGDLARARLALPLARQADFDATMERRWSDWPKRA